MHYSYSTKGTCSVKIDFDIIDGKVENVTFLGGCNGNLKGISALVNGMKAEEVINRLKDIKCGFKQTSCPDQLAIALKEALNEANI
ncbi:MAG: TIGR03905 family TSCPD domain-containing protein [Clostridia bacterium]|nr:TIGR03905 family TSCPD domain-containing protein [Clostridia bacterium]